ncbi:MAG: hypothetical protein LBB63_04095 [Holosporaceae bacterium]|nr:hypothetical protein [Holosporaceae bacterium]
MKKILLICCLLGSVVTQNSTYAENTTYENITNLLDSIADANPSKEETNTNVALTKLRGKFRNYDAMLALLAMFMIVKKSGGKIGSSLKTYRKFIEKIDHDKLVTFFEEKFVLPYGSLEEQSLWELIKSNASNEDKTLKTQDYAVLTSLQELSEKIWKNIEWSYKPAEWDSIGKYVGAIHINDDINTGTLIELDKMSLSLKGRVVLTAGSNYILCKNNYAGDVIRKSIDYIQKIGEVDTAAEIPTLRVDGDDFFTQKRCYFSINGRAYNVAKVYAQVDRDVAIFILDEPVSENDVDAKEGAHIQAFPLGSLPDVSDQKSNEPLFFTIGYGNNFWSYAKRATPKFHIQILENTKIQTSFDKNMQRRGLSYSYGDNGSPIIYDSTSSEPKIVGIATKNKDHSECLDNSLFNWIKAVLEDAGNIPVNHKRGPLAKEMIKNGFDEFVYIDDRDATFASIPYVFLADICRNKYQIKKISPTQDNNVTEIMSMLGALMHEKLLEIITNGGFQESIYRNVYLDRCFLEDDKLKDDLNSDYEVIQKLSQQWYNEYLKIIKEAYGEWTEELKDRFVLGVMAGNCGELANYFLNISDMAEETQQIVSEGNIIETIKRELKENAYVLFRLDLGGKHSFVGIKIDNNIEIMQAWMGVYTIQDWLLRGENYFTPEEFDVILDNIITDEKKANDFFKAGNSEVLIKSSIAPGTIVFSFKTFNNKESLKFDFSPRENHTIFTADKQYRSK